MSLITDSKPKLTTDQVARWLATKHGSAVADLEPLAGGFWSAAFAYRVGRDDLVLRFSDGSEGIQVDTAAMRFRGPDLPIPVVLETGPALGAHFAVSRRHFGRFVEQVPVEEADNVGRALTSLLTALRAVPSVPNEPVNWYRPGDTVTWQEWLRAGFADRADSRTAGWRAKLSKSRRLGELFATVEARFDELLPACPERRDLVHGDLLHQNVLVSDDASRVTGVFSWKCSVRGDFLFDVAWCTFWSAWHPGIAAADMWVRTLAAPDLGMADLRDAAVRHHCYELQIAASHFGWYVWTGDDENLEALANTIQAVLERGPLDA